MEPSIAISGHCRHRLPGAVLLLLLLLCALLFVELGWSVIRFPYPVDYGEGPLLDQAVRWARGENVYDADLTTPPFTIANYPPLYALAQVPWVKLVGPAYWYGRLLSWLAAVVCAVCITLIVRTLTCRWTPALIGGLSFLAMPFVTYWAPLFRVDLLALAFSLTGLLSVIRAEGRRGRLLVGAVLMTAAVGTRQTYALAAPLAAVVWLAADSRRRALGFAAALAACSTLLFLSLEWLSGGGFFLHVIHANVNTFSIERLLRMAVEAGRLLPLILVAGALFLLVGVRVRDGLWRVGAPYLVASVAAAMTIGKSGSNVNYWLESCAALSIATAALVSWSRRRALLHVALMLLLSVQVSLFLGGDRYREHARWKLDQGPRMAALSEAVRQARGPVLADEELGLLPLAGRPLELQPFELSQLARRGVWNQTPLLEAIERGEFELILMYRVPWSPLHQTRWTAAMRDRIERCYEQVGAVGPTVLLRPRATVDPTIPASAESGP